MKIFVAIKQVPDTTDIKIDPVTNTLIRQDVKSIINPFDLYAIEEALRLTEKYGGDVTAFTMGPPQAEAVLREVVGMGVKEVYLISDRKFAGADTWATSLTLAQAAKKIGDFDLILFGQQAIDGDTAQVGAGVAAHLKIPQTTFVRKFEKIEDNKAIVQRLMEDGHDRIELPLPAIVSVVKEINEPRLPSLRGKRKARKAEIKSFNAQDLELDENEIGLNGSPTQVIKIFSPEISKTGEIHTVDAEDAINLLFDKIVQLKNG